MNMINVPIPISAFFASFTLITSVFPISLSSIKYSPSP
jgi:hypothetical protein